MAQPFTLTAITTCPTLARRADDAGVDRIGIDIERVSKAARQGHMVGARINDHEILDLEALRPVVRTAALFARLNPLHEHTRREVDAAVAHGASVLMLPYFTSASEVDEFVRWVDERARVVVLVETAEAVASLQDILAVAGIDEVMVGLNDLSLSLGLHDPFGLLASDLMEHVALVVRAKGLPFGFGGLARAGDEDLPVPADLVIAQHARLGSTAAWLARSFWRDAAAIDVGVEVGALRARLDYWAAQSPEARAASRLALRRHLAATEVPG